MHWHARVFKWGDNYNTILSQWPFSRTTRNEWHKYSFRSQYGGQSCLGYRKVTRPVKILLRRSPKVLLKVGLASLEWSPANQTKRVWLHLWIVYHRNCSYLSLTFVFSEVISFRTTKRREYPYVFLFPFRLLAFYKPIPVPRKSTFRYNSIFNFIPVSFFLVNFRVRVRVSYRVRV